MAILGKLNMIFSRELNSVFTCNIYNEAFTEATEQSDSACCGSPTWTTNRATGQDAERRVSKSTEAVVSLKGLNQQTPYMAWRFNQFG